MQRTHMSGRNAHQHPGILNLDDHEALPRPQHYPADHLDRPLCAGLCRPEATQQPEKTVQQSQHDHQADQSLEKGCKSGSLGKRVRR